MSTAGPLALARKILEADSSPFFVLNSDVICNYPFTKMLETHKAHGKEGTIVVSIDSLLSQSDTLSLLCNVNWESERAYLVPILL